MWGLRKRNSGSTALSLEKKTLPGRQVEGMDVGKALEITVGREELPAVARTVPVEALVVDPADPVDPVEAEVRVAVAVPEGGVAVVAVEGRRNPHVRTASILTVARGAV